MMYIIAVYLNSLVIVAFLALIMHSLKFIPRTDINPDSYYYNDPSFSIQQNSNNYHEDSCNQSFQI